ncbi:hypothetical protein [Parafrankia sp. FMc2]|uniref:hypothetical protein n=1 Tax=Parafrankia sp. FMc2 TaxID=3233196 RepID=UPI0034D62A35
MTSQPESIRRAHMDELVGLLAAAEAQVVELTEQLAAAEKASAAADDILAGRELDLSAQNLMIARRLQRILDARTAELADVLTRADDLQRALDDPATELGRTREQLTAVHDVIDHWLDLHRTITPAALPTIRLTAAAAELLSALGADQAEVLQLLEQAGTAEQADTRPRGRSELADRVDTIARLARRVLYLEDELVDAWHDGHRTNQPLRDVLGMTEEQYATWASGRPDQAATRSPEASSSEQVAPPEQCRSVVVQDRDSQDVTVAVLGAQEMTEQGREALGHIVQAAVDRFADDLGKPPPVLRLVATAFIHAAAAHGILLRQAAANAGVTPAAVSRTIQGAADAVHLTDLVRIAAWVGLDIVAVPRPGPTPPNTPEQEHQQ